VSSQGGSLSGQKCELGRGGALNDLAAGADEWGMRARAANSHVLSNGLDETRETLAGWREGR
jgi:hypothetical protein